MTASPKDKAIQSILNKFSATFKKLDLKNMSTQDVADIKQELSAVQMDIDVLSQFTPDNDPDFANIKAMNKSINDIFNNLNRFEQYL